MKKIAQPILRTIFLIMILIALVCLLRGIYATYITNSDENTYFSWSVSDWMINYEGGFVRRGLCGQLFYYAYQCYPYPVRDAILIVSFLGLLFFLILIINMFIKEGWSLFILIAPWLIIIPSFTACHSLFWLRRDHWALLTVYGICNLYSKHLITSSRTPLYFMWLLSALTLLMHEATFFMTFPLLIFHNYTYTKHLGIPLGQRILKLAHLFFPAIGTMFLVCLFKGDSKIAEAIWKSWGSCIENYPLSAASNDYLPPGIAALTWDTWTAIKMHIHTNFRMHFCGNLSPIPFYLLNIIGVYYLTTRINSADLGWHKLKSCNYVELSNLLILQFICMLPMFTVLSCDTCRIMAYWVFSTLFAYHSLKPVPMLYPKILTNFSSCIQTRISKLSFLSHSVTYAAITLFLPITPSGTLLTSYFWTHCYNLLLKYTL